MEDKTAIKKNPANIDRLKLDINECKRHLESLLEKLSQTEIQYLNNTTDWPTLLNSFAILSSDLITISKVLKDKNAINLKNSVFVPKSFSEDVDQLLQESTQNRMSVFNSDLIPHILRTKLSPDLEEKENQLFKSAKEFDQIKSHEKNITQFRKAIGESHDIFDARRKELETTKQSASLNTYSMQDTYQLAMTIMFGANRQHMGSNPR